MTITAMLAFHQWEGCGDAHDTGDEEGGELRGWLCLDKQTYGNIGVLLSAEQLYLCQQCFQVSSS